LIGQTLAHYRITAALGAGGMGEVYRATDTSLEREVAIKVLPAEVAQDPERLARFKREAHFLAALNHPNIATIHGLEEADGKPFLVLELVEGENLGEYLARGGIPVDEALGIATQVARALEEAHGKGILHRDLKPDNVKLTPDGNVKVLDFGIAKAWSSAGGSFATALSQSPTLVHTGTVVGKILGTPAYMSPEQALGKPVDQRADVWSFGVLLGEMLTGRALFSGGTDADTIEAVVTKEPNLEGLPATTPEGVRRLLGRCLRKDPRTRWPDIGAARLVLEDALFGTGTEAETPTAVGQKTQAARQRLTPERWIWAAVVLALVGVALLSMLPRPTATPEAPPDAHFTFDTPAGVTLADYNPLAVSPDGRTIVFAGRSPAGTTQLWTRRVGAADDPRELPRTEGAGQPFWSPDSASIGFFAGGELKKVSLASGHVQTICVLPPESRGPVGTWSSEGTIVFSLGNGTSGLYAVSASGGRAAPLTTPDERTDHWWPQFLPDGRRFLFEIYGLDAEAAGVHADNSGVYVASLDAPDERHRLLPVPMRAKYGSGHLLFVQDGSTLTAQPFDAARAELTGDPIAVASSVAWGMVPRWGWFSVSATDVLAYVEGITWDRQLVWFDRAGKRLGTLGDAGAYRNIALSPDGRRVATQMVAGTGLNDIWVIDVARGIPSRVTTGPTGAQNPVWSPDGRELIFGRYNSAGRLLYRKELRADATASALRETAAGGIPQDWSHDGETLLYLTIGEENALWALPVEGDGPPEQVLKSAFSLGEAQMSPDGQWLAYASDESGRYEIYVEPFHPPGDRVQISHDGGSQPKWRGDGRELFYRSLDGQLMAVDIQAAASGLEVGTPAVLVPADALRTVPGVNPGGNDYAVTADGQRFLVMMRVEEDARQRIHVVTNWPSRLE
jgi:eukaryotic-like serine/threonine-protein kinase